MFVCGYNDHGQLGLGDTTNRNTFTAVPALPDGKVAKQVIAGGYHTMILAEDGTVFACGTNTNGELGLGDDDDRNTFTAVPFFGANHPGLVPWTSNLSCSTFAAPPDDAEEDAPAAADVREAPPPTLKDESDALARATEAAQMAADAANAIAAATTIIIQGSAWPRSRPWSDTDQPPPGQARFVALTGKSCLGAG